jgi:hypothetical protein
VISVEQRANVLMINAPALNSPATIILHNVVPKGTVTVNGKKTTATIVKQNMTVEIPLSKMEAHDVRIER